jgi:hypothetical protein
MKRAGERGGRQLAGGAAPPACLLASGQRSLEDGHVSVELVCGGALSRGPRAQP